MILSTNVNIIGIKVNRVRPVKTPSFVFKNDYYLVAFYILNH